MDWKVLKRYKGEALREIALPVGGIGTGFFSIGGRGDFVDWQLMNRPSRGWKPPYSHLVLRVSQGDKVQLRVLEGPIPSSGGADFGNPETLAGIPRFQRAEFEATYPFGRVSLYDNSLPVDLKIEVFNPLIPRNSDASGLPFGILSLDIANKSQEPVDVSITMLLTNFIGWDKDKKDLKGTSAEGLLTQNWQGLFMSTADMDKEPRVGSLCLLWDQPEVHSARSVNFPDRAWRHDVLHIIDQLLETGHLEDHSGPLPDPDDNGHVGGTTAALHVAGNQSATANLFVGWHFPWRMPNSAGWNLSSEKNPVFKNYYATRFEDAKDVASKTIPLLANLRDETCEWVNSVVARPAPDVAKEAALFNLTALRTHTCFRLEDGQFVAFEGCGANEGCCSGSCSHVWNYEEATIQLFPDLHRSMLESHLDFNVTPSGGERFRVSLPLQNPKWEASAADGQMGLIVRAYQQFQVDKDQSWLTKHYPSLKKMMQYAWIKGGWDADRDGVMEGAQHNTYDVEFFGPNPLCTVWYLAGLAAISEMAKNMGDSAFAGECDTLRAKGAKWVDENLYNGSYYIQKTAPPRESPEAMTVAGDDGSSSADRYQVGNGCLIDQLVGQYKANRAGLGDLLDRFHLQKASLSIFKNNFYPSLQDHYNSMRTFAYGDEAGSVICSYPEGGRPAVPFPYWSECMTGFEYQLAAILYDYGHKREATEVIAAIRKRHDGTRRNPFNEPECGSFYARSMASWALLEIWKDN